MKHFRDLPTIDWTDFDDEDEFQSTADAVAQIMRKQNREVFEGYRLLRDMMGKFKIAEE